MRKCKLNESLLCHADQLNLSHSVFVCAETGNLCCKESNLCRNVLAGFQCVQVYSRRRVLYCQVCSIQFVKVVYSVSFTFDSFLVDFFSSHKYCIEMYDIRCLFIVCFSLLFSILVAVGLKIKI